PGGVGVANAAPGEVAGVLVIPGEELAAEELGVEGERGRRGARRLRKRLAGASAGRAGAERFWGRRAGDHAAACSDMRKERLQRWLLFQLPVFYLLASLFLRLAVFVLPV